MVSETIAGELKQYAVGEKLRALRLKKKMGLVELSRHTGLSAAMLSKVERGKLIPTLPTLIRMALVFSVGLEYFFSDEARRLAPAIVRAGERLAFPDRPDAGDVNYRFESLDFKATERALNAYLATFEPVAADRAKVHTHQGAEFLYVLSGRLLLRIGEDEHRLDAGDSVYFDPAQPHSYRREGRQPCTAIVVTT
jgi:transcriptional regulator with XRE-family HTH domain